MKHCLDLTVEKINDTAFIAPQTSLIGDITIGEGSSVWFGAVLRGDVNPIRIGDRTNIQDLSVIHVTSDESGNPSSTTIGDDVTIGHRVTLHGCTIEDCVLVGMGSIVMDHAVIEKNAVIGAGSLVTEGMRIPSGHLAFGRPAKVVRPLTEPEIIGLKLSADHYKRLAQAYRDHGAFTRASNL